MREIKFRAWIPLLGHGDEFPKVGTMYYWKLNFQSHGGQEGIDKNTVMQYTGLKDKNGKEIYEGDIVKDESGDFWIIKFGKLPLNKAGDCVCTYQAFYAKALHEHRQMYDCVEPAEWQEIIGNIYENPELLNNSEVKDE